MAHLLRLILIHRGCCGCPKCSGDLRKIRPELSLGPLIAGLTTNFAVDVLLLALAAFIAAFTSRLFGLVAALAILLTGVIAIDYMTARLRCEHCGHLMRRLDLVFSRDDTIEMTPTSPIHKTKDVTKR